MRTAPLTCFAALIIASSPASAKTVDLRRMTDSTGEYMVSFCARPSPGASGLPGHAFVAFSKQAPGGNWTFHSIGLTVTSGTTPASAAWSYFGDPVSGQLKPEVFTSAMQTCLNVSVNSSTYQRAEAFSQNPLAQYGLSMPDDPVFEFYKLGNDDCISFLVDVANTLKADGLSVPTRHAFDTPVAYVEALEQSNQ